VVAVSTSTVTTDRPEEVYRQRLDARRWTEEQKQRQHLLLSNLRLAVFLAGAALAWLAFVTRLFHGAWVWIPVVVFLVLVALHNRALRRRDRARRAVTFYERGLARLEGRWVGEGEPGERFRDESHPSSEDLDLFGRGSLFELLCTARTSAGQQTLAGWLTAPAAPEEVRSRQAAVEELRGRVDLREDLALLGDAVEEGVHPDSLSRWSTSPPRLDSRAARRLAFALNAVTLAVLLGWLAGPLGPAPVILVMVAQGIFAARFRHRARQVTEAVAGPGRELDLLAQVLARIEAERFSSPLLCRLRGGLDTEGVAPSRRVGQLDRCIDLLDWRRNQFFMPIALLLMWTTHLAFALERWRRKVGPSVPGWLEAVGEFEALLSLAAYAYEHPTDPFPELLEGETSCFEAESMGHPFLPDAECVRNDLSLRGELRLLIVSGSNMSGKSTLLRTVGVNAVLAQAGGPVRARRLSLSTLTVGASIRINDSLQAGRSRFYTEITRLRELVGLTEHPRPLLFLLDEILHGTNSHDRQIGAEAVVRELVERGAIGLVTTHDLALANVAESLAPRAANIHFQDHLEDGRMVFDYRIHRGVVRKSNALELMRAVGLPV